MSSKITRRGFHPDDQLVFSNSALELLLHAQIELHWLLDRGYNIESASEFIGNHYQLTLRQRNALRRATSSTAQYRYRASHRLDTNQAREGPLLIDGFNLIVTLEVALSGSPVIRCGDGTLRDLAGLRGTYKPIRRTFQALELIELTFRELGITEAVFYLDAPVSNSGRLKKLILEKSVNWSTDVRVELVPNADTALFGKERIVTSDSAVIDNCKSWLNLTTYIVEQHIGHAWIVRLMSHE